MMIRHLFPHWHFKIVALGALLGVAATAAWARHPEVNQMDGVQRLARQLSLDSATLAGPLVMPRNPDLNYPDNLPLVAFHNAADQFYRQVTASAQNPDHTEADFIALRDACRRAWMYYELGPSTPAMRAAMARTHEAMRALIDLYSDERVPADYDPAIVRQTAAQIVEIANRLDVRAADEYRSGRVGQGAVRRISAASGAAHHFYDLTVATNAAPGRIDEEYDSLVQRLLDARMDMASFTMDFQDEYGALWHLTQSINFLSPGAAVGGPPYTAQPPWR